MSSRNFWIMLATTALFIAGCANQTPTPVQTVKEINATKVYVPQRVHRKVKLKKVDDNNFSSEYMYPEDKVKKEKVVKDPTPSVAAVETTPTVASTVVNGMSKDECVGMIGQGKFDKYTHMFGNEASSIKRCTMLKAMN